MYNFITKIIYYTIALLHADWSLFLSDLPSLSTIQMSRYFSTFGQSSCHLLGFCDAPQLGYDAVVYLLVANSSGEKPAVLVGSKTKLAPIEPLTIPRLELNAHCYSPVDLGASQ